MKLKMFNFWGWLTTHPVALFNVAAVLFIIVGGIGYLYYQSTREIDVLKDWRIELTDVPERRMMTVDGVQKDVAIYNPGDSLLFTSQSEKLENATGITYRYIVCIAVREFKEREILIDTQPAVRNVGVSPKRDNAIFIPDVTRFEGLPRLCKLVIDIGYDNVTLQRDHNEHAETELFLVEEEELTATEARKLIAELNARIKELEAIGAINETATPTTNIETQAPTPAPQSSTQPANPSPTQSRVAEGTAREQAGTPADDRTPLGRLPVIGGLLDGLGL